MGANITWSAPASNDPAVAGYEVFYDGSSITVDNDTTSVIIDVAFLLLIEPYTVFVVAYSTNDTLPSQHSNNVTLTLGNYKY